MPAFATLPPGSAPTRPAAGRWVANCRGAAVCAPAAAATAAGRRLPWRPPRSPASAVGWHVRDRAGGQRLLTGGRYGHGGGRCVSGAAAVRATMRGAGGEGREAAAATGAPPPPPPHSGVNGLWEAPAAGGERGVAADEPVAVRGGRPAAAAGEDAPPAAAPSPPAATTTGDAPLTPPPRPRRPRRPYSNVDPVSFQRRPGSLIAAAALVAGTTVGAGVLALPAVTASSGFVPSSAALCGVWAVAAVQALLLAETAVNTQCALGRPSAVSILSMARATLGDAGAAVTSVAYGLLHVAILTAFTAQGGTILTELFGAGGRGGGGLPVWSGAPVFSAALGAFLFFASDGLVARVNNALVVATVALFLALVAATAGQFQADALLTGSHWGAVIPDAMPVLLVSLVFHNVVPYVCSFLEGDRTKIRAAVVGGSLLPLLMFLTWNGVILGSSDVQAAAAAAAAASAAAVADSGVVAPLFDPVALLRNSGGATGGVITGFSLLAVVTSYVGVVAGLVDFANDGFLSTRLLTAEQIRRWPAVAYAVTLVPPTVAAVAAPDAFFGALDVAGAFGVSVLFGLLPCAMAWRLRYGAGVALNASYAPLVPGGRAMLAAMMVGPAAVLTTEAMQRLQGLFG